MTERFTPSTEHWTYTMEALVAEKSRDGIVIVDAGTLRDALAAHDAGVRAAALEEAAQIADKVRKAAMQDSAHYRERGNYRVSDMAFGRSVGAEHSAAAIRAAKEQREGI